MRIAVVHSFYSRSQPSGENAVVEQQVDALRARGHDVRLFGRETDTASASESFYNLRSALRVATGGGRGLEDEMATFRPDLVHVHNLFPNFGSAWLSKLAIPIVMTVHNHRFECSAATLFRDGQPCNDCLRVAAVPAIVHGCYRNRAASVPVAVSTIPRIGSSARLLERADVVLCLNNVAGEHLSRRVSDPTKVRVLVNFPADSSTNGRAHPSPIDVLYVGRLSREKGILDALGQFPQSRKIVIVGEGPDASEIARLTRGRPNMEMYGRRVQEEIQQLMGGARVLLVPSRWAEGFPTVALEAMQQGLPLVMCDQVAVADELQRAGVAATFSFEGEGLDLSQALAAVDRDEPAFRKASRAAFNTRYSKQAWLEKVEDVYALAVERSSRSNAR